MGEMEETGEKYERQVIRGRYFPHIDGLRAIAVLGVMLYHLQERLCPGGFTGVDVFFVISGYLIGGGILKDLRNGSFSMASFYTRRIKRIMPAYFTVICATLVTGLALYHYEPLESLGNAALRSAYFFANFFCYKFLGDYFAGDADTHPLMHLWSLSVEEQFYIAVPLLMLLLWKLRRGWLLPLLGLLLVASLLDAERLLISPTVRHHIKAFYFLESRAWELLLGVIIAGLPALPQCKSRLSRLASRAAAWGGLLCIVLSFSVIDAGGHFPGAGALWAVAGAGLTIYFGGSGGVGWLLSARAPVWVGRLSYSLYLWHWTVIAFARYCYGGRDIPSMALTAAALLSLLLASFSWHFVEMPIRRSKRITFRRALLGLLLVCALVGGVGALLFKTHGLVHVIHRDANRYASLNFPAKLKKWASGRFGLRQMDVPDEKGKLQRDVLEILGTGNTAPTFFFVGDSHAEALKGGLDVVFRARGAEGIAFGCKTCPLSGVNITNTFYNATDDIIAWLRDAPSIRTVIILCRWDTRMSASESHQLLYRVNSPLPRDDSSNPRLLEEGLTATCRRIRALGKQVILLGPVPVLKCSPGSEIRRRIMLGLNTSPAEADITEAEFVTAAKPSLDLLHRVAASTGARIVLIHPHLIRRGLFRGIIDNKLFYHDSNHLSAEGAEYVASRIIDELNKWGKNVPGKNGGGI